jgi:hypothetical protein
LREGGASVTKDQLEKFLWDQGLMEYFDLDGDSVGQLMIFNLVKTAIKQENKICADICNDLSKDMKPVAEWAAKHCAKAIKTRELE